MNPFIYHIRLSDFELNAERLLDPGLRTRAIAIISSHHPNGTIISLSDEAIRDGLYAGMKVSLARKCLIPHCSFPTTIHFIHG